MHLCGRTRLYSGYGTAGGVPSTCLQDVVLVPFPTWLLLLLLPLLWFESTQFMSALDPRPRRTKAYLWLTSFYVLAIFAALLMSVLEIVRLARADRGIGLLPFDLVGLLAALALSFVVRGSSMKFSVHVVLMLYWTLMIVMLAVKTGTLVKLKGREDRKGTAYPTLDQITDIVVLLALYILLFCVEAAQFRDLQKSISQATKEHERSEAGSTRAPRSTSKV